MVLLQDRTFCSPGAAIRRVPSPRIHLFLRDWRPTFGVGGKLQRSNGNTFRRPYISVRELALAGTVVLIIWRPPGLLGRTGMKSSSGARGSANLFFPAGPVPRAVAGGDPLTDSSQIAEQKAILRGHMTEQRAEAAARDPDAAERLAGRFPVKLFERYGPVVSGMLRERDELDPSLLLERLKGRAPRSFCRG